jgi:hypothetical protein
MSAASTPAPRSSDSRPSSSRSSLFLPIFILLLGLGGREVYLVMSMEDQLDRVTQNVDKMDPRVKVAQYERSKFYMMASEVLRLAPKDPNADKVATLFGLRQLQADKPELMNANAPSDLPAVPDTSSEASAPPTNAAPLEGSATTNAASEHPASPANK